jgi:hypothetical protein
MYNRRMHRARRSGLAAVVVRARLDLTVNERANQSGQRSQQGHEARRVMNELMLRATGRIPEDDEPVAA